MKAEAFFQGLEQLYGKVLLGAALENDSCDYICYLHPAFSNRDDSTPTCSENSTSRGVPSRCPPDAASLPATSLSPECLKRNAQQSSAWETAMLQLTVIRVMITRILSSETELRAKEKYRDIIKVLLTSCEVDSKLTWLLENSDKLLAHMAAKCLALFVYFQLREKMTVSKYWVTFCQKNLSVCAESDKIVSCLSTLTVVIKEVFKDPCSQKTEILKQFLTPFDTVLEEFYTSFFSQHFESLQDTSNVVNSLMSFLDLLELLIATRVHLESHFTCQRLLFLRPSCVLHVITWPVQAFVKRKCLLFIKKCLLHKVGEDLCCGPVAALMPPDPHFGEDMLALAEAVLQAVHLGLLRALSIHGKPSCFGGEEVQPPGCAQVPGPDHVILRAASLLIIKSLEIKFQSIASVNEMKADLQRFMSKLLAFLKPHLRPSLSSCNPCEWLSKVFIEQDDDMLEAAKASLSIYLKLNRDCGTTKSLTQEKEMWEHHTHENGYNPHCIFLFFLRNIGFDGTVLLDFLISSETCFLEYFVRYLKLLQKDWNQFFTICKNFDGVELKDNIAVCGCEPFCTQCHSRNQAEPHLLATTRSQRDTLAWVARVSGASLEPLCQMVTGKETLATLQGNSQFPPKASQSLVDYDSSDDSEVESTDQHLVSSQWTSVHQEAAKTIQDTGRKGRNEKELSLEPHSRFLVPEELTVPYSVHCDLATNSLVSEGGVFHSTVRCFEELQGAIQRLQKKNLFPYNPTALLKLLKHIEEIYNKSVSPL